MSLTPADEKNRRKLIAALESLPPLEQSTLQLFSIAYEPASRTALMSCANKAGLRPLNGAQFTSKTWKPLIQKLLDKELLEEEKSKLYCNPLIVEVLARRTVREGRLEEMVAVVHESLHIYTTPERYTYYRNFSQLFRDIRLAIYRNDTESIQTLLARCNSQYSGELARQNPWLLICNNPFDREWMSTLPPEILETALYTILVHSHTHLDPADEPVAFLAERCAAGTAADWYYWVLAEHLLLTGQLEKVEQLIAERDGVNEGVLRGWRHVLMGDDESAIACYQTALKQLKKGTRKRKIYFNSVGGIFFILTLLRTGGADRLDEADDYISIVEKNAQHSYAPVFTALRHAIRLQQGKIREAEEIAHASRIPQWLSPLNAFFTLLVQSWIDPQGAKKSRGHLEALLAQAEAGGYRWLAAELEELLHRLGGGQNRGKKAEDLRRGIGTVSILDVVKKQEPWERALEALVHLKSALETTGKGGETASAARLIWRLSCHKSEYGDSVKLQPIEQKSNKNGQWTRGRSVALKRLFSNRTKMDFLTPQDEKICTALETYQEYGGYGYGRGTVYGFDLDQALPLLVGHPLIFRQDDPEVRVELITGEPELQVIQTGNKLRLGLVPAFDEDQDTLLVEESPTRFKVISITPQHRNIAGILGDKGLKIPATARKKVLDAITSVSSIVTVHSDIGGTGEQAREVEADPRPHLRLVPVGTGLRLEILVRPFAPEGAYFRPGTGGAAVFSKIDGQQVQTRRDLALEQQKADELIAACPALERAGEADGQWIFEDPQDCLELLLELQNLGDHMVVEWPQGEKMQVRHQASFDHLALKIRRQNDWFSISGELRLDDSLVLDLRQLLESLQESQGRFLPLGDGQFVALTEEFRRRLEEVDALIEKRGRGLRFHPLRTQAFADLTEEVGTLATDRHWNDHLERLRQARELNPALPSTLQAELRDYQTEGFRWAARLAHWGVGACLADDMGLGKTVQALALVLDRAPDGPALVVAPTSVCMNWIDETRRFAPTLRAILFGPGDREKMLTDLRPFDLVVCSYGLLYQEEKQLTAVTWQTIVLDEAQAIKNMATRRSQAAMKLQGEFKMITTGTPIENHLGELWNLFRFINPGLLGSVKQFDEQFAIPIEKHRDKDARNRLKRLLQPFILRRTKSQVLEELPPRTEILLRVELSREEMALYEALRRQAVDKLADSEAAAGQRHVQILAEIMKLRRVCCHARLVLPDAPPTSAKLEVFGETLEELLENRHKALVFSQFVDHLSIVRRYLDDRGVSYQYLDGRTPVRERKKRVDAFQSGQGDLFLISLRAGGQGLNLTAADYVIHLDPWWNPAVEDQASDRVHRIGQERPVTIYRLVARDTIEEKIVDLHARKRDLADSLLEGSDMSGRMSAEELLALLRET